MFSSNQFEKNIGNEVEFMYNEEGLITRIIKISLISIVSILVIFCVLVLIFKHNKNMNDADKLVKANKEIKE